MNYNFKFAHDFTDSITFSNLKSVEDSMAKTYRHLKGDLKSDTSNDDLQIQVYIFYF